MSLLVRDGRIVDITPATDTLTSLYPRANVFDARDRIVMPGFVNSHFHGESVLLRFLTQGTPFASWQMIPALREALSALMESESSPIVRVTYEAAAISHLMHGTTSIGEYPLAYTPALLESAVEASNGSGIESVFALQSWDQVDFARTRPAGKDMFAISLGNEEGYTVYSFEGFVRASREMHCPLAAHIGEQRKDVELLRRNFKKTPMRVLREYGLLRSDMMLIHCNHMTRDDLAVLGEVDATLTLCASSAATKQTGYPMLRHLADGEVRLCLGTDWGSFDVLSEMQFLRRLPTLLSGMPTFSALELMRMATINGAYALGISAHAGSLEIGKKANLVMMPLHGLHLPPVGANPSADEIAATIVEFCDSGMITDVMTDGVFRIRDGKAHMLEDQRLSQEFRRVQKQFLPDLRIQTGQAAKAVPFAPSKGNAGTSIDVFPQSVAETKMPASPARSVNLRHPEPPPEEVRQNPPALPKTIKKVFGEDDL